MGSDRDMIIVDIEKKKCISTHGLHHIADFTVHEGWELTGRPVIPSDEVK